MRGMRRADWIRLVAGWATGPAALWALASDLGAIKITGGGLVAAWVVLVLAPGLTRALDLAAPATDRTPAPGEHPVPGSLTTSTNPDGTS